MKKYQVTVKVLISETRVFEIEAENLTQAREAAEFADDELTTAFCLESEIKKYEILEVAPF
jgi:hypothetical protein